MCKKLKLIHKQKNLIILYNIIRDEIIFAVPPCLMVYVTIQLFSLTRLAYRLYMYYLKLLRAVIQLPRRGQFTFPETYIFIFGYLYIIFIFHDILYNILEKVKKIN
jgi:hypothetical protein